METASRSRYFLTLSVPGWSAIRPCMLNAVSTADSVLVLGAEEVVMLITEHAFCRWQQVEISTGSYQCY